MCRGLSPAAHSCRSAPAAPTRPRVRPDGCTTVARLSSPEASCATPARSVPPTRSSSTRVTVRSSMNTRTCSRLLRPRSGTSETGRAMSQPSTPLYGAFYFAAMGGLFEGLALTDTCGLSRRGIKDMVAPMAAKLVEGALDAIDRLETSDFTGDQATVAGHVRRTRGDVRPDPGARPRPSNARCVRRATEGRCGAGSRRRGHRGRTGVLAVIGTSRRRSLSSMTTWCRRAAHTSSEVEKTGEAPCVSALY